MAGNASAWALLILAGTANAAFGLPMKYVHRWGWENTWAVWSLLALVVLPIVLAFPCIPTLPAVYRGVGFPVTWIVFLLGAGWGLAQVLFGKAMHTIGIGLAFSIVLGISAAAGSLLPPLFLRSAAVAPEAVPLLIGGLLLIALGVAACAQAGLRREHAWSGKAATPASFLPGLVMAVLSGLLASFMNLGLAFGSPLTSIALAQGASSGSSNFAVWLPLLLGGAVPNLVYCAYLLSHRSTWNRFRGASQARNLSLAAAMAILWFFSTVLYGVAAHGLGAWGVVLGWPVFMSLIVIVAGLFGIATGEWRHSGRAPILFQAAGILLLVIAIVAFSRAQNAMRRAEAGNTRASVHRVCASLGQLNVR